MRGRDRVILQKIGAYIDDVVQYVAGLSFEEFQRDKKTLSACAFAVSQMGELAKDISAATQISNPKIPWKSIRGMRNKIIHDYENIDLAILWGTITNSLPDLKNQIERVLSAEAENITMMEDEEDESEDWER